MPVWTYKAKPVRKKAEVLSAFFPGGVLMPYPMDDPGEALVFYIYGKTTGFFITLETG